VKFTQLIHSSNNYEAPTAYDVLACIQKNHPGTFEEFCSDYGYNSRPLAEYPEVLQTYRAVLKEWNGVSRFFTESEIQLIAEVS